jgi:hypothetical protein
VSLGTAIGPRSRRRAKGEYTRGRGRDPCAWSRGRGPCAPDLTGPLARSGGSPESLPGGSGGRSPSAENGVGQSAVVTAIARTSNGCSLRIRHYRTSVRSVKGVCEARKGTGRQPYTRPAGAVSKIEVGGGFAPQRPRYARVFAESTDYILEPCWKGTRALAVVGPQPEFVGDGGEPVEAPRELLQAIAAVTDASSAVLDGVIVDALPEEPDLEVDAEGDAFQRPSVSRNTYVAFDLLEVDGASLLDAPLLERKRHLAGVLRPGPSVRISPFVRRGMRAWRETLAGQGFKQVIAKRVNSKYRPGATNDDWLRIEKL